MFAFIITSKKKKKKTYIIERREGDNIPNSESSAETL